MLLELCQQEPFDALKKTGFSSPNRESGGQRLPLEDYIITSEKPVY